MRCCYDKFMHWNPLVHNNNWVSLFFSRFVLCIQGSHGYLSVSFSILIPFYPYLYDSIFLQKERRNDWKGWGNVECEKTTDDKQQKEDRRNKRKTLKWTRHAPVYYGFCMQDLIQWTQSNSTEHREIFFFSLDFIFYFHSRARNIQSFCPLYKWSFHLRCVIMYFVRIKRGEAGAARDVEKNSLIKKNSFAQIIIIIIVNM